MNELKKSIDEIREMARRNTLRVYEIRNSLHKDIFTSMTGSFVETAFARHCLYIYHRLGTVDGIDRTRALYDTEVVSTMGLQHMVDKQFHGRKLYG